MKDKRKIPKYHWAALVFILIHSLISFLFLEAFPYVHSDESWLAGLTRAMMEEGSIGVTEPFFDLVPRYPHSIKTLFHLLQMAAVSLFGYRIFSLRLVSLGAGAAALWFTYLAGGRFLCRSGGFQSPDVLWESRKKGFLVMAVFSMDIQFLYASHFARQEILLSLIQWICLWNLFAPEGFYNEKRGVILGILTGISIGFHPNSFVLGVMNGCCFLGAALFPRFLEGKGERGTSKPSWRPLLLYIAVTGGFALVFVGMSFMMDPGFPGHYVAYGKREFGIDASWWERIAGFFGFLKRLYERNSGTYYLPDIRPQFFLFGLCGSLAAAVSVVMKKEMPEAACHIRILLTGAAGVICGIICIGRYNQTSILFVFPFGYLAAAMVLELYEGKVQGGMWAVLFASVLSLTAVQVVPELKKTDYAHYGRQIRELVPEGAKVLGNLNAEFFMGYDCLRDYRNLPYAMEGEGLSGYLERNEIEYIIYHEELDYLWEHRPYYNVIYGNVMFVQELKNYCLNCCEEVGSFQNSRYGIRVAGILGQEEYAEVTVYRRASSSSSRR